jgi:hypothetical protein
MGFTKPNPDLERIAADAGREYLTKVDQTVGRRGG